MLRIIHKNKQLYNDKESTFEQLLEKDSSVSINTRNLRFLAVEMFKFVKGLAPTTINDLFTLKGMINSLFEFKSKVKSWNPINCLCKTYIEGIGYI